MRRGGPLARKTPLQQGTKGLSRGTPLAQSSAKPYPPCDADDTCKRDATRKSGGPCAFHKDKPTPKPKPKPAKPGITDATRVVVLARCGGRCEACGGDLERGGGVHMHHRQRRRTGDHSPANLVALHPNCHVVAPEAVHQRPEWAKERGLIVVPTGDPATTPLVLPSGRRVLLGDTYTEAPPVAA